MKPPLKIAILGCRGIPNCYGGFEQLAQQLAAGLVKKELDLTVYNSHHHPYQKKEWEGVKIIHCYDAENLLGTAGQFIYDLNCILHARKQNFDIILFLGYTSSSVWWRWFPKNTLIISNMDGLEWKRSKYSKPVQRFLQYAEKLAVLHSDYLVADSLIIQSYLGNKYNCNSHYIAYGAALDTDENISILNTLNLAPGNYFMLMARMEPENNIDMILEGFHRSNATQQFIVLGKPGNSYGKSIVKKYGGDNRIHFAGAIYEPETLHTLRKHCSIYFHGHSVGGTNPSLLEAMADKALIAAHDNEFNRSVLGDDAYYFCTVADTCQIIESGYSNEAYKENNFTKVKQQFNWPDIISQYLHFFETCLIKGKK